MRLEREKIGRGNSHSDHDTEGAMRWLLTYADMITLLMAFFIMLYSASILNLSRFREMAVSIRSGFSGSMSGQGQQVLAKGGHAKFTLTSIPDENAGVPLKALQDMRVQVKKDHLENTFSFRQDERGLVVSLVTDKALFPIASADLTVDSRKILDIVADLLKKVPNQVLVEGHTCDLPVASEKYPSNWELSTARAAAVVRYFIEDKGTASSRLSAAGYADSKPLPDTRPDNREKNRRVDIVILKTADVQVKPKPGGLTDGYFQK